MGIDPYQVFSEANRLGELKRASEVIHTLYPHQSSRMEARRGVRASCGWKKTRREDGGKVSMIYRRSETERGEGDCGERG